jgi:RNA polymerase sigma-70 factor (ECF subfamily)
MQPQAETSQHAFLGRAQRAEPDVTVPDEVLLAYAQLRADPTLPADQALAQLEAGDLKLACAAVRGDPAALQRLEGLCAIAAKQCGVERGPEFRDELTQTLMVDLAVKSKRALGLERYRGRGRLLSWLSSVAFTTALNLRRGQGAAHQEADELTESLEVMIDWQTPELLNLKHAARAQFKEAFQQAVLSLDAREQNVLRLRCVEGATDASIAAFYKVTRVSVVRWLQAIRHKLLLRTRKVLADDLSPRSVDSLLRTLDGELDASLERFFHEHDRR